MPRGEDLAKVLFAFGPREQALEHYRQAVEIDSSFAKAWNNLGNTLAELGNFANAEAA